MSSDERAREYAVGIDLGGSRIKIVALRADGEELARTYARTADTEDERENAERWVARVRAALGALEARLGAPAARVGLAAPGLAAPDGRSIAHMPGRLRGLERLDWTRALERAEGLVVLNDAHAALLGEARYGAARGLSSAVLLTLGTGVGGALLVDGRLVRGRLGRAGHLGHVCLDPHGAPGITGLPGTLEEALGEASLPRRSRGAYATSTELLAAVRAGEPHAEEVWGASVRALACGIASLVNVLDPEALILAGGVVEAGAELFEPLRAELSRVEWRPGGEGVRLLRAELGDVAGAVGAACMAGPGTEVES